MSNFFAALDDDDDDDIVAPVVSSKKESKPKPGSKATDNKERRNTKQGGRGGRAPSRSGKRAYDRRSGTGRGKEIKKGGAGARNWGSDKNEARNYEGGGDDNGGEDGDQDVDMTEPPEEDNTMSYEDYLKQKEEAPKSQAFAPIKERTLDNEFSNVSAKVIQEEDFLVMGGGKQIRKREKKKDKVVIESGFRVAPSDSSSNDRDGRGRGRGGRGGRGGDRGGGRGRGGRDGRGGGRGRGRDGRGGGRGRGRGRSERGGRSGGNRDRNALNPMDGEAFPSL